MLRIPLLWIDQGSDASQKMKKIWKFFKVFKDKDKWNWNAFGMILNCFEGRRQSNHALRVFLAVIRLTVYCRLQVMARKTWFSVSSCKKSSTEYSSIEAGATTEVTRRAWVYGSSCKKSNTKYSCLETPGRMELFVIFGRFFEKSWIFYALT